MIQLFISFPWTAVVCETLNQHRCNRLHLLYITSLLIQKSLWLFLGPIPNYFSKELSTIKGYLPYKCCFKSTQIYAHIISGILKHTNDVLPWHIILMWFLGINWNIWEGYKTFYTGENGCCSLSNGA